MRTLTAIFAEIGHFGSDIGCNDKGGTHTYLETYEKLFSSRRNGASVLEIGLALGDSIKLWDQYFENSKIIGVDISVVFTPLPYRNDVNIIQADATKPEFIDLIRDDMFDIIIDDGSHMEADQIGTFELLKHKMKPGGVYIIEDILAIDQNRPKFQRLHPSFEVVDMRHINRRFDNVLIIYYF